MRNFDYPRSIAIKALEQILNYDKFSNEVLLQLLDNPKLSILDRKFITAMVYGVLDYLPLLDETISNSSSREISKIDSKLLNILRLGAWQILFAEKVPKSSAVDESVKLASHFKLSSASGFVNAILRAIIRNPLVLKKKQEHLKYGMSSELFGLYKKWFGSEAGSVAASYLDQKNTITVLYTGSESEREQWLNELSSIGVEVTPGVVVDSAYNLSNLSKNITNLPGFEQGLFYVQDESSMLATQVMCLEPGNEVLDACAGLGGKSFSLLAENPEIKILALEPNSERFIGLIENKKRLRFNQIKEQQQDLQSFVAANNDLSKTFDRIILDVPCSGLGVLKHKPEIKLNLTYDLIQEFPKLQLDLLVHAAEMIKSTGKILYNTCTINPAENEELIELFLQTTIGQQFEVIDISYVLSQVKPQYKQELAQGVSEFGLQIRPDLIPIDGFFISYLKRKNDSLT